MRRAPPCRSTRPWTPWRAPCSIAGPTTAAGGSTPRAGPPSGSVAITFNGEIFNHGRVRAELAALGHRFRGHSDTEVLLAAFAQWGVRETIPRLVGMFAIALWDRQRRRLFLVRDRFGKKPLFVYHRPGLVLWGSELKSLMACPAFPRVVDLDAMRAFLGQAYVPAPRSIFRHTIKLPPASLLEIADPHAPLPGGGLRRAPRRCRPAAHGGRRAAGRPALGRH